MTPEERITRGKRAEQLLSDPLLLEAFKSVDDECLRKLLATGFLDKEERESIYYVIQAGRLYQSMIRKWITDGKIAQRNLDEIN